ncbi:ParB/RepB/Spo0J family partition protein [Fusibacillus kribbianus]|uniref:ParB/RepB/Spo0J family partition protein n=1 Tax=Fusibacillus kribbianus TaxID=3044208 RepID=A0AAP4BBK8_9FIRM|nr:ParB/RepB/Spo0J family partition protein [Ruminococcus sp. YH-rum2234]MDI9243344.1 ParB/RepB/Spo0J family partition protein [Ruminococcus sp. YH-rum2234]
MKANNKRKVFGDAVDLLVDEIEEREVPRGIQMIQIKKIQSFHDHPFHLYEGERLEDMIASVKEHGILNPVIVQKIDGGYEMLSGHNRMNAAKLAGLKEVPAIVKTDLSEEEAYVYVIETNLMQRSFSDLLISEKAAVLKARYEKESCQGRRNDIIEEIARLEGKEVEVTRGHGDHRMKTRDTIGKEYELSGSSVGRLLKLNDLIKPFKDMVDRGALYTKVALQLAFLPEEEQNLVLIVMKEKKTKVTIDIVMKLRSHSGALTDAMVRRYLSTEPVKKKCYKVPARIVEKYFVGMDPNKVDSIVELALEAWFHKGKDGADV